MRLLTGLLFSFLSFSLPLAAQTEEKNSRPQVILDGRSSPASVPAHVESGHLILTGEAMSDRKRARRRWEDACQTWKKEMRGFNRQNLMLAHCGSPQLKSSKEGDQAVFFYESKADYKIRVLSQ
jgi:hypothetical protein